MTWMRKSTATMEPRDMRPQKLQLVIDEQSPMRIKPGQLDISGETKTARILRTPEPPTDAVRMAHNATHVPFRDWCLICVASRGRCSPHRRVVVNKDGGYSAEIPDGLHVYSDSGREQNSAMYHIRGNAQWSSDQLHVRPKGGYEDLTKEILRHFEAYGFLNPVIIQYDKEMSIIDVCRKVASERKRENSVTICAKHKSFEQTGLSKQYTDTYRDSHDATRHKLRRTLSHSFQQFHLQFHLQFVTLDLFSQDSQCDPTAEPHSNICSELHMKNLCACLVNLYSR